MNTPTRGHNQYILNNTIFGKHITILRRLPHEYQLATLYHLGRYLKSVRRRRRASANRSFLIICSLSVVRCRKKIAFLSFHTVQAFREISTQKKWQAGGFAAWISILQVLRKILQQSSACQMTGRTGSESKKWSSQNIEPKSKVHLAKDRNVRPVLVGVNKSSLRSFRHSVFRAKIWILNFFIDDCSKYLWT